jgi:hypothetical protein
MSFAYSVLAKGRQKQKADKKKTLAKESAAKAQQRTQCCTSLPACLQLSGCSLCVRVCSCVSGCQSPRSGAQCLGAHRWWGLCRGGFVALVPFKLT